MDIETIKEHREVEVDSLAQVADALRATMDWKVAHKQFHRKLSSVRFVAHSYQRYLERMLALEEHDGYMVLVEEGLPHWSNRVAALKKEHDSFRHDIRRITTGLDQLKDTERPTFENLCHDLLMLAKRVEKHNSAEAQLLMDAVNQDDGSGD